ncbi:MAG: 2,3,4,5-tetrahydropyridine-2,6-dicarboxylate N-succinyltransferase [Bdellovibrionota bacterium]
MKDLVEAFYDNFEKYSQSNEHLKAVTDAIAQLDTGKLRICDKVGADWKINDWAKKAVLLYFRIRKIEKMEFGSAVAIDKMPLKQWTLEDGVRVVPGATARYGAYLAPSCVMMPSYVNIGAYVDAGTMVDTWATVGSCAQIGKGVHLSGGVGIGGVLEPLQASPVIIEDHCFIGSRAIVVEGVRVCEGAVLGANVVLTGSTPIIDVRGKEEKIYKGIVPPRCVVIPGTRKKTFPAGDYQLTCALIIGERTASTDQKTSLNSALRDFDVPV